MPHNVVGSMTRHKKDGFIVYQKNDGADYWDLFQRFRRGEVESHSFSNAVKERDVLRIRDGGRTFILKWDRGGWGFGGEGEFERFFWRFTRGPYYSRLMRRVAKARLQGCDAMQEIFMVAERRTAHFCHEAVMVLEYLEGPTLQEAGGISGHEAGVTRCLQSLHKQNLALCDINVRNFIITAQGVKALDLVCRGNPRLDRIKDVIRAGKVLGIDLPVTGIMDKALLAVMRTYQNARTKYEQAKMRRSTLSRDKYFR